MREKERERERERSEKENFNCGRRKAVLITHRGKRHYEDTSFAILSFMPALPPSVKPSSQEESQQCKASLNCLQITSSIVLVFLNPKLQLRGTYKSSILYVSHIK